MIIGILNYDSETDSYYISGYRVSDSQSDPDKKEKHDPLAGTGLLPYGQFLTRKGIKDLGKEFDSGDDPLEPCLVCGSDLSWFFSPLQAIVSTGYAWLCWACVDRWEGPTDAPPGTPLNERYCTLVGGDELKQTPIDCPNVDPETLYEHRN